MSSPYAGVHRLAYADKIDRRMNTCLPRRRGFTTISARRSLSTGIYVSSPYAGVHRGRPHRSGGVGGGGRTDCVFPVRGGSPDIMAHLSRVSSPRGSVSGERSECLPPRTRGSPGGKWAYPERWQPCSYDVSSPYAGVHRLTLTTNGNSTGCLPRTRGFTALLVVSVDVPKVSSPYAGVHRRYRRWWPVRQGVFPVRGGSPVDERRASHWWHRVFPVRGGSPAEMDA